MTDERTPEELQCESCGSPPEKDRSILSVKAHWLCHNCRHWQGDPLGESQPRIICPNCNGMGTVETSVELPPHGMPGPIG